MSRVSQARSLGKYFLLVDNMLVVLGFFVVFPLISIRFVDQMGWAALMVGIALGLRQFVQQGLGIFGGAIADRFGAKPLIVTGMLMRAAGFATMARGARALAAVALLLPLRSGRHPVRSAAHRAGGQTCAPAPARPLLLHSDDAGQRRRGCWRPAGQLAAAVRFPSGVRGRGGAVYSVCAALFNALWLPAWKPLYGKSVKPRCAKGWHACCATGVSSPTS